MAESNEVSTVTVFGLSYLGIGYVLGFVAGIVTFIASYIYCIGAYGFLFGLGLGWLPSGILAAVVGWATVFLWGPALALGLLLGAVAAFAVFGKLVVFMAFGGAVGWLVWRFAPKSLSGRS